MEGRPPFDPDDLDFDFDSPRRRAHERDTGERPIEPPPREEPPSEEFSSTEYEVQPPAQEPYDTGESAYDYDTTGERAYDTGEDPFDTGERRRRREQERKSGFLSGLRLPGRRRRDRRDRPVTGEHELRDDPYTPAEVPVAGSRRSRHRDLPANVRRRQAFLAGGVVIAVLIGIVLLARAIFGGGGSDEGDEPLPLKKLVGQTIIGKLGKADPDRDLLRRVRKGQVGGFIATAPQDAETLAQQAAVLQEAAKAGDNPPLLIMIDQEGGEVERLDGPPNASPPEMGEAGADTAQSEGSETGSFLKTAGVNVDLAPVLDVELPQTADSIAERTFGDDPALVGEVGSAFITGLQSAGVAATAKHFPGLGPATLNTDDAPVTIAARDETLQEALQPFQAAIDAKVQLMMVGSAIYPDYGPENPRDPNRPASSVKAIVTGLLREQMGFQGVCITDDLQSVAIETLTTAPIAGVSALGAGCDLLLFAGSGRGSEEGFNAVVNSAKKKKTLSRDQLQASYDRITTLKDSLAEASSG